MVRRTETVAEGPRPLAGRMTLPWAALPDVGSDAQRERWASEDARLAPLHARLGHTFTRPALLRVALTHPSWVAEHRAHGWPSNAALEFFGDAVLDLCSAHAVWSRHPSLDEGRLTKLQIELVSEAALASVARDLALGAQLWLGRGEDKTGGRQRDSNLADAVEAVLGAVFLDAQLASPDPFGVVLTVFEVCFAGALERLDPDAGHDPKSALQQLVQARYRRTPRWVLAEEDSPGEARERGRFVVELIVDAESSAVGEPAARIVLARGEGSTRREAEIVAARAALLQLRAAD